MAEVRKIGFGEREGWTNIQFWKIVQLLGTSEEVLFDKVVVNSLFGSNPEPLIQLERAGLISLMYENGRPFSIKTSRPLYTTTFKEMLLDTQLSTFMELQTAKHFYKVYEQKLRDYENELELLSRISSSDANAFCAGVLSRKSPLDARAEWLVGMVDLYGKKTADNMAIAQKCEKMLKV